MNISENTFLRGSLVVVILAALTLAMLLSKEKYEVENKLTEQVKNLSITNDSLQIEYNKLHDENFGNATAIGRYEITLDHLKEVNPKAAKEFEDYLYTHTE